jgi:hypothetical protein
LPLHGWWRSDTGSPVVIIPLVCLRALTLSSEARRRSETHVAIPQLSPEQLQAARQAAATARRSRAELKARVRSSAVTFGDALDLAASNDILAHVKVVDLLKCLPRVGDKRAAEVMERLDIAPNRRLRGLGRHQVAGLKAEFS